MARIIGEVRPGYVLVENSPILTSRGLGVVLGDLAALGYDAEWGVLGAINAGAPHLRNRIWIVAHAYIKPRGLSKSSRREGTEIIGSCQDVSDTEGVTVRPGLRERGTRPPDGAEHEPKSGDGDNTIPDPNSNGLSNGVWGNRGGAEEKRSFKGSTTPRCPNSWWRTEPNVGRVANGVATRVDRLKALGEGQVPAVVRIAWRLLR
jgi:DNA (cytosine-5)-methyltransferase 1